eukprot:Transcript_7061.p1 GENE.Transcript_7061~~Transcript_7061.p1  ORF type:complete len:232 (+),score=101.01 Transcript_7061:111-806(+)
MDALLATVRAERDAVASADEAALGDARAALSEALNALLLHVATTDVPEDDRRALDAALSPDAAALKGALLKALKVCALHRAFLGLPALMEETRKLLTAAPAKGVATYLEVELCADIDACTDPRALVCVQEVLKHLSGDGKLKKELGGFELSGPAKKSCRTASNRASKAFIAMEAAQRQQAMANGQQKPRQFEMDRDVRVEDAELAQARYDSNVSGLDKMFDQAMAMKNKKL